MAPGRVRSLVRVAVFAALWTFALDAVGDSAQAPGARTPRPRAAAAPAPRAPRIASYSIDAELDPARHVLNGREVITWRNATERPAQELRLHLYWNAWRNPQSTWLQERRLGGAGDDLARRPGDWAAIDLTAVRLLGLGGAPPIDLTPALRYPGTDTNDGASEASGPLARTSTDRTLARVPLPAPIAPGETVNLAVEWTSVVPRTFARTGRIGEYYFIAHWFPKMAVLENTGWNAHEFHTGTEFFADYGVYDVRLTVPAGWIVGATGRADATPARADGKATHRFRQEDVHDFAWVTSPDLVERRARFTHGMLPAVEMRLLLQPEHVSQADRYFAGATAALRYYGEWFGPYPYGHVTIVDPAWQSGSGGMEYPTLFTGGTSWLAPRGVSSPEGVTVHEAGHQFWYGLVANNEFEHAWLDEGVNTFATARVLAEAFEPSYHSDRFFGGFIPWVYGDLPLPRLMREGWPRYRLAVERETPSTPSWRYFPATGPSITYSKTALWLHTLERMLGWPTLRRILATFFERYRFRHPSPEDFFAVANEVSGRDLTWFFDQVHRSSHAFDYAVDALTSAHAPHGGYADGLPVRAAEAPDDPPFETEVVVRRLGGGVFPVTLLVTFDDGRQIRESWDGRDRWRAFRFTTTVRARTAVIDPDDILVLDVNRTNNSRTLEPAGRAAATKWSFAWLTWLQDRLLTSGIVF